MDFSKESLDCPYCGGECRANYTTVGEGYEKQITPHVCIECGATEIGPNDDVGFNIGEETLKKLPIIGDEDLSKEERQERLDELYPKDKSKVSKEEWIKGFYKPEDN